MESLYQSKNKNVKYILCVINVFTIHARVKPSKDKKVKQFLTLIVPILDKEKKINLNFYFFVVP